MSYFKFVPDLFLETAELTRFQQFLSDDSSKQSLLNNSVQFGLIRTSNSSSIQNARVERDLDNALGQKTIKISEIKAIDSNGRLIYQPSVRNFPIPADGGWHWLRIRHQFSNLEVGTVNIDATGNLTGVGTKFTEVLRGAPNFASTISFVNSVNNTLEYEVLEVIDDTHAVLVHPAINANGFAEFATESQLSYRVVGTFTGGVAVPNDNKYPFNYDSCFIEFVPEITPNTKPTYVVGQEFYIARVRINAGNLVLQDKRSEFWKTKTDIELQPDLISNNPIIGVETIKWQNLFNTGDRNMVEIAWSIRSANWSVDTSQNIITLYGSSIGGSLKNVSQFVDGSINGWRLYTKDGSHCTILNSIKQGGAINLYVDILDIDHFSNDGGETFIEQTILATPNADSIELMFTASNDVKNVDEQFIFPITTPIGKCLVTAYTDPVCLYNVKYRYKSHGQYSEWTPIVSGSYFREVSFDKLGVLKSEDLREVFTYVNNPTLGFIELTISPNSFNRFANTVYKGDVIGVNTITSFDSGQILELKVGRDKRYQYVTGNISLSDDVYISLSRLQAVEGNEFRIHFEADSLNLGDKKIFIVDDYALGTFSLVKEITQSDSFAMKNQDGGIVVDCVFDNTGKWFCYTNYNLGQPSQIITLDGNPNDLFDLTTGLGKVKGLFGFVLCDQTRVVNGISIPDLRKRFLLGSDMQDPSYSAGQTGGSEKHTLTKAELPAIDITPKLYWGNINWGNKNSAEVLKRDGGLHTSGDGVPSTPSPNLLGEGQAHNNMPPFYSLMYAKRAY